jgi:transcriptional regulator with XRE-family HTH domain
MTKKRGKKKENDDFLSFSLSYFVPLRLKLNIRHEKTVNMSEHHTIVGAKIKGLRETKNISVEEIAERSGLTAEQITSIENDQNLPSLGPLIKIARALGVRLGTFMDDNDALGPVVCRAEDRERDKSISFSNGATDARKHMEYHPLAQQKAGRHMEPFVIDINPEDTPDFQLSAHEGEEFIYVMNGEVEVVYGKETFALKEGDSIFYDSIVKHHVHGAPGKSAKILAVVYIPF